MPLLRLDPATDGLVNGLSVAFRTEELESVMYSPGPGTPNSSTLRLVFRSSNELTLVTQTAAQGSTLYSKILAAL